jgi:hypothetical protein
VKQVCPDHQLLSVYFDGELPSPWKEKMDAHVAACPQCAGRLKSYQRVSINPAIKKDNAMLAAQERLWKKLEQRSGIAGDPAPYPVWTAAMPGNTVWRRRVSVPIPAAAAAVFLVIALVFVLALRVTGTSAAPGVILASETGFDTPGIIPMDMEDVLKYLSSRDDGDILILQLPESRSFVNYSEPEIIKAADYSRQRPRRTSPAQTSPGGKKY